MMFENIPIKQFSAPRGIAVDPAGNVYVVDAGDNRIQKFDSKGALVWEIKSKYPQKNGIF
jgi:DNA-binding beta-propeller fold protein YncE